MAVYHRHRYSTKQKHSIREKPEDLENRERQNNLGSVEIPESVTEKSTEDLPHIRSSTDTESIHPTDSANN